MERKVQGKTKVKTKTVLRAFDYMHCDDLAKYLNEMAAKGWHFKEWGIGFKFEQGEPETAVYAVEVFTKASADTMRPEPETAEFAEYCEAAGWKFIDGKQKFCIFKKVKEDAVPMFTPEERVRNAFCGMTSGSVVLQLVLCGICALLQWIGRVSFFEKNIFSASSLSSLVVWNLLFLEQCGMILYAFLRKKHLMKAVQNGEELYIGNADKTFFTMRWVNGIYISALLGVFLIYLLDLGKTEFVLLNLVCVFLTVSFWAVMNKIRPDSNELFCIQILMVFLFLVIGIGASALILSDDGDGEDAVQQEELLLEISDYREWDKETDDIRMSRDKNLLGSSEECYIFSGNEIVFYQIYRTSHTWILDKIWSGILDRKVNESVVDCTEEWKAQNAIYNDTGTYYVRFENSILIFGETTDSHLTTEQIGIICDKLELF